MTWVVLMVISASAVAQTDWTDLLEQAQRLRYENSQAALELLNQGLADVDPETLDPSTLPALADLFEFRGALRRGQGNYELAAEDAMQLTRLAELSGEPAMAARAAFLGGSIEAEQERFSDALKLFHEARLALQELDLPIEQARILNAIGVTHNLAKDQERARHYFERAVAMARAGGEVPLEAIYMGNLALVISGLEGPSAALPMLREVLRLGQEANAQTTVVMARTNLCDTLVKLERTDEAEPLCLNALEEIDRMGETRWQAGIRLALGQLHQGRGQLEEAVDWYRQALAIAEESVPTIEDEILEAYSETLVSWGRPDEALDLVQRRLALRDERRERERRELIEDLEVRYQVERSEADLDLLRLRSELQTTQIRQRNQLLTGLLAILVVATLAVVVALRSYRIKAGLEQDLAGRNKALERALEHINELARHDSLTGLLNRRALEEQGRREVGLLQRNNQPLSVILIDVDYFKTVNDRFGHAVGDEVLQGLAAVLRENLREGDLVGRWGGEEFVCLLPGTDLAAAELTVGRIQAALKNRPIKTADEPVWLTVTCGIAAAGDRLDQAINAADRAMYQGKNAGRDTVVIADDNGPAMT